jgi:tetrahydromethanopterin S-methyltransferase subunit A
MKLSKVYIENKLAEAQTLLWGGSETENISAHNIIVKLITDLEEQE